MDQVFRHAEKPTKSPGHGPLQAAGNYFGNKIGRGERAEVRDHAAGHGRTVWGQVLKEDAFKQGVAFGPSFKFAIRASASALRVLGLSLYKKTGGFTGLVGSRSCKPH